MSPVTPKSVFFDAGGLRAKRVRLAIGIVAFAFVASSGVYVSGLFISPLLPFPPGLVAIPLQQPVPPASADGSAEPAENNVAITKAEYLAKQRRLTSAADMTKRFGFINVGDAIGAGHLRIHAAELDGVIVDLLTFDNKSGIPSISPDDSSKRFMNWKRRYASHALTYAQISIALSPTIWPLRSQRTTLDLASPARS